MKEDIRASCFDFFVLFAFNFLAIKIYVYVLIY
jgi:hypothetical protein